MGLFHRTVADNVGELKKWHDRTHQSEWAGCIWEPCNKMDAEFRRVWS